MTVRIGGSATPTSDSKISTNADRLVLESGNGSANARCDSGAALRPENLLPRMVKRVLIPGTPKGVTYVGSPAGQDSRHCMLRRLSHAHPLGAEERLRPVWHFWQYEWALAFEDFPGSAFASAPLYASQFGKVRPASCCSFLRPQHDLKCWYRYSRNHSLPAVGKELHSIDFLHGA